MKRSPDAKNMFTTFLNENFLINEQVLSIGIIIKKMSSSYHKIFESKYSSELPTKHRDCDTNLVNLIPLNPFHFIVQTNQSCSTDPSLVTIFYEFIF